MAVFVARLLAEPAGEAGLAGYVPPQTPRFSDVGPSGAWSWCYRHVEYIAEKGVTSGYPDGTYHPEVTCTRDQMAEFLAEGLAWSERTDEVNRAAGAVTTVTAPSFAQAGWHCGTAESTTFCAGRAMMELLPEGSRAEPGLAGMRSDCPESARSEFLRVTGGAWRSGAAFAGRH